MKKNVIISMMAAVLLENAGWLEVDQTAEKVMIWLALTVCLLFFCIFCDEMYGKWVKYRKRVRELREKLKQLREMKLRKI